MARFHDVVTGDVWRMPHHVPSGGDLRQMQDCVYCGAEANITVHNGVCRGGGSLAHNWLNCPGREFARWMLDNGRRELAERRRHSRWD